MNDTVKENLCDTCSNYGNGPKGSACKTGTTAWHHVAKCGYYKRREPPKMRPDDRIEYCATCCHRNSAEHTYCSADRRDDNAFCRYWAGGPALPNDPETLAAIIRQRGEDACEERDADVEAKRRRIDVAKRDRALEIRELAIVRLQNVRDEAHAKIAELEKQNRGLQHQIDCELAEAKAACGTAIDDAEKAEAERDEAHAKIAELEQKVKELNYHSAVSEGRRMDLEQLAAENKIEWERRVKAEARIAELEWEANAAWERVGEIGERFREKIEDYLVADRERQKFKTERDAALAEAKQLREEARHKWTDGPDGSGYHCSRCGISRCDGHDCYDTCVAWLEQRKHTGIHPLVYGLNVLDEYEKAKRTKATLATEPEPTAKQEENDDER